MKVGDLVRYKRRNNGQRTPYTIICMNNPYRVAIVTMVYPSGLSVLLSEFAEGVPHRIEDLEVVSESR